MHKSVIILLGFLVMLLPFGTAISNSNVMAFEEYEYEIDKYERYGMDMTNGHEEEYQSPPEAYTNDNNYKNKDNNFLKKIKCNNINSNFNGLDIDTLNINLPDGLETNQANEELLTSIFGNGHRNDNYGYRTNGNFDLDCISNNDNDNVDNGAGGGGTGVPGAQGPRGLQGERGPAGAQGPAGPAGISVLNSSNVYRVVGSQNLPNQFGEAQSTAACDPGDLALGGLSVFRGLDHAIQRIGTGTTSTTLPTSYTTNVIGADNVQSVVTCFDNPPMRTSTATASAVSAFQQPENSSIKSHEIGDSAELTTLAKQQEDTAELTTLAKQQEDTAELTATEKIKKLKTQWLELLP